MTEITLVAYTFKHIQNFKRPIPSEWVLPERPLGPRTLEVLRVIEQAENEGRDVFIKDIAEALGITRARTHQHVVKLKRARRVKDKLVGHKRALTTLFTAEDLEFPWNEGAPDTPKKFRLHRAILRCQELEKLDPQVECHAD